MNTNPQLAKRIHKVIKLYIQCAKLYCQVIKQPNQNPTKNLLLTKKLILISQELVEITTETAKQNILY